MASGRCASYFQNETDFDARRKKLNRYMAEPVREIQRHHKKLKEKTGKTGNCATPKSQGGKNTALEDKVSTQATAAGKKKSREKGELKICPPWYTLGSGVAIWTPTSCSTEVKSLLEEGADSKQNKEVKSSSLDCKYQGKN